MLRSLTLLRDRIADSRAYPFTVPAISTIDTLEFSRSRITFFIGENGSGKSTLLEAIAHHYGFGAKAAHATLQTVLRRATHRLTP